MIDILSGHVRYYENEQNSLTYKNEDCSGFKWIRDNVSLLVKTVFVIKLDGEKKLRTRSLRGLSGAARQVS